MDDILMLNQLNLKVPPTEDDHAVRLKDLETLKDNLESLSEKAGIHYYSEICPTGADVSITSGGGIGLWNPQTDEAIDNWYALELTEAPPFFDKIIPGTTKTKTGILLPFQSAGLYSKIEDASNLPGHIASLSNDDSQNNPVVNIGNPNSELYLYTKPNERPKVIDYSYDYTSGLISINEEKEVSYLSDLDKVVESSNQTINNMIKISYEDYLALPVKDSKTRYIIEDAPGVEEGVPMLVMPDYVNRESINRITSNHGEWTVEKSGYVTCYLQLNNNAGVGWIFFRITVNGRDVGGDSYVYPMIAIRYYSEPIPVSKGDVVSMYYDLREGATVDPDITLFRCLFTPLKLTAIQPPVISDENFGNYLERWDINAHQNILTSTTLTFPYEFIVDWDGWMRVHIRLSAYSIASLVQVSSSSEHTLSRGRNDSQEEYVYFVMVPVKNGDKFTILIQSGSIASIIIDKYSSVFVATSAPIVTTRPKTYSLIEKQTDDVWHNGKPIYRRAFDGQLIANLNGLSDGTTIKYDLNTLIPSIGFIVCNELQYRIPGITNYNKIGDSSSDGVNLTNIIATTLGSQYIFIKNLSGAAFSADMLLSLYGWIEYTKTTD